jgi:serine/threonine protein kinase
MAPELLEQRDDYDPKVDIWALGWTFFEVIYGTDPWSTNNVQCAVLFYYITFYK